MDEGALRKAALAGVSLDAPTYLARRATEAERAQFAERGWLVVRGALAPAQTRALRALLPAATTTTTLRREAAFSATNDLQLRAPVVELLTSGAFPKAVDLLGFNLCCNHAALAVAAPGAPTSDSAAGSWQQTGGPSPSDIDVTPAPLLAIQAEYALSPALDPGSGRGLVLTGSHLRPPTQPLRPEQADADAEPVPLEEGDCVLYDCRVWRRPFTPIRPSAPARAVAWVQYAYRWLRPEGPMEVERALSRTECPIVKQMLGATFDNNGLFSPTAEDTPLRLWLHTLGVDEGLGQRVSARTAAQSRIQIEEGDGLELLPERHAPDFSPPADRGHSSRPRARRVGAGEGRMSRDRGRFASNALTDEERAEFERTVRLHHPPSLPSSLQPTVVASARACVTVTCDSLCH